VLADEQRKGTSLLRCAGYTMITEEVPTTSQQIYEVIPLGLPDKLSSKWCVFDPDITLRFKPGRHSGPNVAERVMWNHQSGLRILHYRYLGQNYYRKRDQRNAERLGVAENKVRHWSAHDRHSLPDRTRGVPLDWYEDNRGKAEDVTC
jgi:hypothetical protein